MAQMMQLRRREIIVLVLALAWLSGFFGFVWHSFLDDAYIGFTCIRNCIEGNGLVFNAGERVEGVTNVGWLLVLLPLSRAVPIPLAAKLASYVLLAATVVLTFFTARILRDGEPDSVPAMVVFCTVTSFDLLYFSFSGMETSLLAFLLCLALLLAFARRYLAVTLVMAFAFAVRPETLPVAPVWLALCGLSRAAPWRRVALYALVFVVAIALLEAGRFLYFGQLLPNTFTAKPGSLATLYKGIRTGENIAAPFSSVAAILLMAVGGRLLFGRGRDAVIWLLCCIVGVGLLFAAYAMPDWTHRGRYFAPYVPAAFILLIAGGARLLELTRLSAPARRIVLLGASSALVLAGVFDAVSLLRPQVQDEYPWFVMNSQQLVPAARWISRNTPGDARIAARRIGCLAFYGRRYVFDWRFGLTDPAVAQIVRRRRHPVDSPADTALGEVWQHRDIDYLLEDDISLPAPSDQTEPRGFPAWQTGPASFRIQGRRYSPIKSFRINDSRSWVLCARVDSTLDLLPGRQASAGEGEVPFAESGNFTPGEWRPPAISRNAGRPGDSQQFDFPRR
jgi:arabinofuranosyltransferase